MTETVVQELPAWVWTEQGPEHVVLPVPAAQWLQEHRAVPIGFGTWELTDQQRAHAAGRWVERFGDPSAELPVDEWISARRTRDY